MKLLIELLQDDMDTDTRLWAACQLGRLGEAARPAVPTLGLASLADKDARLRHIARQALDHISHDDASRA
jgi:HEAT repeat protein